MVPRPATFSTSFTGTELWLNTSVDESHIKNIRNTEMPTNSSDVRSRLET